jgi:phosphoribosylamine--glycine ligase
MKVCVIGGGGREHALAWGADRFGHEVVVTRGNPGIPWSTKLEPLDIDADLYVVGPDQPLADGMADRLRAAGRIVFGPGADGARLEGSKAWMKEVLVGAGVPTAAYGAFTDGGQAEAFLRSLPGPYVVKTDYLALGKGVLVTPDLDEAIGDAWAKLAAGAIVVEEHLSGPELSLFAVCDGERAVPLPLCQDHKRVGDGDTGPNTGGMGAYSPVPFAPDGVVDDAMERCVLPTLHALRAAGVEYRGVLYAGLVLTADGVKVIEYNVRFGDPECQVLMPRFESDPVELLAEAAHGRIRHEPRFDDGACVTVVLAGEGYPGTVRTGDRILGLDDAEALDGVVVFKAGVGPGGSTAGGRVLNVTATGPTVPSARTLAYDAVSHISWPGMFHRHDIASSALSAARRPRSGDV